MSFFEIYTWTNLVSLLYVYIQKLCVCVSVQFWVVFYAVETSGCALWGRGLWVMREPITEPLWSITEMFSLLFPMTGISVKCCKNTHEGFEVITCCTDAGGLSSLCFNSAFALIFYFALHVFLFPSCLFLFFSISFILRVQNGNSDKSTIFKFKLHTQGTQCLISKTILIYCTQVLFSSKQRKWENTELVLESPKHFVMPKQVPGVPPTSCVSRSDFLPTSLLLSKGQYRRSSGDLGSVPLDGSQEAL